VNLDIGFVGLGILALISLAFGGAAQLLLGRGTSRWLWLAGAVGWFAGGLFASEVVWGTLTGAEIQPMIDGLAFDESLLGGVIGGVAVVAVAWLLARGRGTRLHGPMAS